MQKLANLTDAAKEDISSETLIALFEEIQSRIEALETAVTLLQGQ